MFHFLSAKGRHSPDPPLLFDRSHYFFGTRVLHRQPGNRGSVSRVKYWWVSSITFALLLRLHRKKDQTRILGTLYQPAQTGALQGANHNVQQELLCSDPELQFTYLVMSISAILFCKRARLPNICEHAIFCLSIDWPMSSGSRWPCRSNRNKS